MKRLMCLLRGLRGFATADEGAVTVDWVVLTALVISFAAPIGVNYVGLLTGASEVVSSQIAAQTSLLP
jgi:hypothetical protein